MKKIIILAFVFVVFLILPVAVLHAADTSFDIQVTEISQVPGSATTNIGFMPTGMQNAEAISYWKVRVYCEDAILVQVNELLENLCGKAAKTNNTAVNNFYLSMVNTTGHVTAFSFKLKAYDKNGRWLHSEKISFQWK